MHSIRVSPSCTRPVGGECEFRTAVRASHRPAFRPPLRAPVTGPGRAPSAAPALGRGPAVRPLPMPGEFSLHGVFVPTLLGVMLLAYLVNSGLHALL
ncbi:DUF1656 domain-containing protein, partial [Streptomyces sp. NPDC127112]|uniref:DUF1656 domain-containing protein n=1 Tax=Streptomyces sp. NPDC127112 TaxID=3345364 RepID=UPI003626CBEC